MLRKSAVIGLAVAMCGLVSACGPKTTETGSSGLSTPSPSASASIIPTTPKPTPTPTPAKPKPKPTATLTGGLPINGPVGPPCDANHVKVTVSTSDGAMGTQVQRFIIKNTGSGPCDMQSYPFISPYGLMEENGGKVEANLDVTVDAIPGDFGDLGLPGGAIGLAPGDTVVFFLKWSDVPIGDGPCTEADGFDFRPPQDPSTDHNQLVEFSFTPCGDALQVSQVFPPSVTG